VTTAAATAPETATLPAATAEHDAAVRRFESAKASLQRLRDRKEIATASGGFRRVEETDDWLVVAAELEDELHDAARELGSARARFHAAKIAAANDELAARRPGYEEAVAAVEARAPRFIDAYLALIAEGVLLREALLREQHLRNQILKTAGDGVSTNEALDRVKAAGVPFAIDEDGPTDVVDPPDVPGEPWQTRTYEDLPFIIGAGREGLRRRAGDGEPGARRCLEFIDEAEGRHA